MKTAAHPIAEPFFLTIEYMYDIKHAHKNGEELKIAILTKKFKDDLKTTLNNIDFNCDKLSYKVSCIVKKFFSELSNLSAENIITLLGPRKALSVSIKMFLNSNEFDSRFEFEYNKIIRYIYHLYVASNKDTLNSLTHAWFIYTPNTITINKNHFDDIALIINKLKHSNDDIDSITESIEKLKKRKLQLLFVPILEYLISTPRSARQDLLDYKYHLLYTLEPSWLKARNGVEATWLKQLIKPI